MSCAHTSASNQDEPDRNPECVLTDSTKCDKQRVSADWAVLQKMRQDSLDCVPQAGVNVLQFASLHGLDGAGEEWVDETIESLCIYRPGCLKGAMAGLSQSQKERVEGILKAPLLHSATDLRVCG